ncbi:MAG: CinA family protein [Patescibacteria group bacterium]|nr:CinA family protein [Patescibacteria group bacterium]
MPSDCETLTLAIHASPHQMVMALSGGGTRALAELLEVPGASRTLLEAVVPYSRPALLRWLGGRPDRFCSARTARAMAMVAFCRAGRLTEPGTDRLLGVACTAGLATDRARQGEHRAHVAVQTDEATACWSLHMAKDRRSRREEEQLVAALVLNAVAEACEVADRVPLALCSDESVNAARATARPAWRELLLGRREVVCEHGATQTPVALLSGAFNPLHVGHRRMAEAAERMLGGPVHFELPIINADKPPLDYMELEYRLGQFVANQPVLLTRSATFEAKSALFRGVTFIVGVDTVRRIASPTYYGNDLAAQRAALERIAQRDCRFLVFGRDMGTGFMRLGDLDLPDCLRAICREVPADVFREDISSTTLRRKAEAAE